jgi:hypothetical protein
MTAGLVPDVRRILARRHCGPSATALGACCWATPCISGATRLARHDALCHEGKLFLKRASRSGK